MLWEQGGQTMRMTTLIRSLMLGALTVQAAQAAEPAKPQAAAAELLARRQGQIHLRARRSGRPHPRPRYQLGACQRHGRSRCSPECAVCDRSEVAGIPGGLSGAGAKVSHDKQRYGECPGPLPGTTFGAHGIDVQPKGKGSLLGLRREPRATRNHRDLRSRH